MQAGHALIGALMPEYDPVAKISIVPRGAAGGLTFFSPSEERLESGLYRCGLPATCPQGHLHAAPAAPCIIGPQALERRDHNIPCDSSLSHVGQQGWHRHAQP